MDGATGDRPVPRGRRYLLAAGVLGLAVASTVVWRSSYSTFTTTTDNGGNSFAAGTVTLSNNLTQTVLFDVPTLKPADQGSACILVTYNGTLTTPQAVKLYVAPGGLLDTTTTINGSPSTSLSTELLWSVEIGTGSPAAESTSCATMTGETTIYPTSAVPSPLPGTNKTVTNPGQPLSAFATTHTDYSTGLAAWTPTATGQARLFRFTYRLANDATNTSQGTTCTVRLTWEVDS